MPTKTKNAPAARPQADDYGVIEWLRSHRIGLAPVYVGLPVLILGIVANVLLSGFQITVVTAAVLLAAAVWILSRVGEGWRRVYLSTVVTACVGWDIWASTLSTPRGWTWAVCVLLLGAVLLAIPHWLDRVKRVQVHLEGMIRDWPIRGARIGLGTTRITNVQHTEIGWTAKLRWADGEHMVDKVRRQEIEIESALGLESGTLKVSHDGKSNSSVVLNVQLEDPHEKGIFWQIPTRQVGDRLQILTLHGSDQIEVGVRTDGTRKTLRMFVPGWGARQCLIAGMKGSGKSGLLNRIWAHFALCDDVVQLGIDLKGGAELGPWRGAFEWIATTREEAVEQMRFVWELVEYRNSLLSKFSPPWKKWKGSPEHPWVAWSIDEVASLLGNASTKELEMFADICRKARSAGVAVIMATQYPTLEALGSSQIRQQIDQRFCFRMADGEGEGYVMSSSAPINAHKIDADRPGTCYHEDNTKLDPLPMRVEFVGDGDNGTPDTIGRLVSVLRGKTPELDEFSINDAMREIEAWANREWFSDEERDSIENETPAGEREIPPWNENGDVDLSRISALAQEGETAEQRESRETAEREAQEAESRKLGETEAREALVSALREAGPGGTSVVALADAATRRKTWTYDRLNELEEAGQAKRTGTGNWCLLTESVSR